MGGHVFPVLRCEFGVYQTTDWRGRVTEKVRFEPPTLVMDVPRGNFLLAWAAAAKRRPASCDRGGCGRSRRRFDAFIPPPDAACLSPGRVALGAGAGRASRWRQAPANQRLAKPWC